MRKFYKSINKKKEFYGNLISYDKDTVTIDLTDEDGEMTFERSDIALIREAFDF